MPEAFQTHLAAWTESLLWDYTTRLERRGRRCGAKEFNDPIWGTIRLRPVEVAVLDSPLLQRLRFVSQLGVVHFVYPAANHTRAIPRSCGCV